MGSKDILGFSGVIYNGISSINKKFIYPLLILGTLLQTQCDNKKPSLVALQEQKDHQKNTYDPHHRKYSDLYAAYLGYFVEKENGKIGFGRTEIGDTIFVPQDVNKIMELLWKKKFQRENKKKFTVAKDFYNNIVSNIDFSHEPKSDIETYKDDIKEAIIEVKDNLNYNDCNTFFTDISIKKREEREKKNAKNISNIGEKPQLWDKSKQAIRKEICDKIDEDMILSYNMTEFFPAGAPGGKMEYRMLDHMLKYYGQSFVFHVPAVADDYASFGSYQFTSLALYDTPEEKRGASIINQFLPAQYKIPGSVTKLNFDQHHKAAYLFAMYNIYNVIRKISERDVANNVLNIVDSKEFDYRLPQIIAIGHNYPSDLNYVSKLLAQKDILKTSLYKLMKGKHTEAYAAKTYSNYVTLLSELEIVNEPHIVSVDNVFLTKDKSTTKYSQTISKSKSKINTVLSSKSNTSYNYLRRSNDDKYDIYRYTFQEGGNGQGAIAMMKRSDNKFYNKKFQIVDKQGNNLKTTVQYNKGESIYLKVSK